MSALFYNSILSSLKENEIIEIDKRVVKNREVVYLFIRKLPSNSKRKAKQLFIHAMFIFQLGQPLAIYGSAVILPLPPAMERLSSFEQDIILGNKSYHPQTVPIIESKIDKMVLTDEQIKDLNIICYKLQKSSITTDEAVLNLRAGGFYDWASLAFIIYMFYLQQGNSFQNVPLPHQDPFGWLNGKYNSKNVGPSNSRPTTYLEMEKPASMPQQKYSGMTKSERRQLPDPIGRDRSINVDGYPRLDLRFNQVKSKTPKHGKDHGLPVGSNGKTPKTEANALALRDSLIDMANNQDIIWYTDGQYQGGTQRGYDSVNLFDPNTNIIAVYQKQRDGSYLFLTTCTLTDRESDHLKSTNGNFVTEVILDQQNWVSEGIGITPISPMDENSSPGFSPTSSFESDVMGITPIDNSQSNNP